MREEIVYYCDACNTAYDNRGDAARCETSHVPDDAPPHKYGVGDILMYHTIIGDEIDIQYARFDEDTIVFWDPALKTWVYRLYGDDIMEEGITLVMSAAEYAARLQDVRTKLESEYAVTLPNRFPGPYIDIRLYPRSKTESEV